MRDTLNVKVLTDDTSSTGTRIQKSGMTAWLRKALAASVVLLVLLAVSGATVLASGL